MNRFTLSALLVSSTLAIGCDEPLEPGTKIDSFRVLAQQADLPYARPGETVRLSTLSHDPSGRAITWAWASCVNPDSSDLLGCLAKIAEGASPEASVFALGEGEDSPSLTIPEDALAVLPQKARAGASVGIVSAACPGELSMGSGPGGLPFVCKADGRELALDEFSVGIKRLMIRERDRNENPVIAGITFDGSEWAQDEVKEVARTCDTDGYVYDDCSDSAKHQIAIQLPAGTVESGIDELGHDFTEQVIAQYYATEGIFENEIKTSAETKNGWVARKRASGQRLTFWFVVRDNRGGVTWTTREAQVAAQ